MHPTVISWKPIHIAGLRGRFSPKTAMGIPALWSKLSRHFGEVPGQIQDVSYGASFHVNETEFDYVAGFAVKHAAGIELPEGFVLLEIPETTYLVFEHRGHVQTLKDTIHKIFTDWLPGQTEWKHAPDIVTPVVLEVYDERFDPKQGSGIVELWVAVKPASA